MGCRRRAPTDQLRRVVRTADGDLEVGRARPGRGAWVCPDAGCIAQATRRRAWARALRGPVRSDAASALVEDIAG